MAAGHNPSPISTRVRRGNAALSLQTCWSQAAISTTATLLPFSHTPLQNPMPPPLTSSPRFCRTYQPCTCFLPWSLRDNSSTGLPIPYCPTILTPISVTPPVLPVPLFSLSMGRMCLRQKHITTCIKSVFFLVTKMLHFLH